MAAPRALPALTRGRESARARLAGSRLREYLTFLLFVTPNLALLALFSYWPLLQSLLLSFVEWNMIAPERLWVGWDNWRQVLGGAAFRQFALTTLLFTVCS